MATTTFTGGSASGGFDMGWYGVGSFFGIVATTPSSSHSSTHVTYDNGAITLTATGNFPTYDIGGNPSSGAITGVEYTVGGATMTISGVSVSVANVISWVFTNNFAALETAFFGGADTFTGTDYADRIFAYGGNDTVNGGAGNDILDGGDGNDTLNGGTGADTLHSGAGSNILNGEDGDDTISSTGAADAIDGGDGVDTLSLYRNGSSTGLTITVSDLSSSAGVTLADGTSIKNIERFSFYGSNGDDTLIIDTAGSFGSYYGGGAGTDTLIADFSADTAGLNLNPGTQWLIGTFAGYSLESVERFQVTTGSGADTLTGGTSGDTFSSGAGNDQVYGRDGDDVIIGGAGEDRLMGENGDDNIQGGDDNDIIDGGFGVNTLSGGDGDDYITGSAADFIDGGAGTDTLRLNLLSSSADVTATITAAGFTLTGVSLANVSNMEVLELIGGSGNDTYSISGLTSGEFRFYGGAGTDRLVMDFSGVTGALSLNPGGGHTVGSFDISVFATSVESLHATGGSGNDQIYGGAGNDILRGGAGRDFLSGQGGADILEGGDGDDTIVFGQGSSVVDGGDGIDQTTLDRSSATSNLVIDVSSFMTNVGGTFEGTTIRNVESFIVIGGSGDDLFQFGALMGDNVAIGGDGVDRLVVDWSSATSQVQLSASSILVGPSSGRLEFDGIESVTITSGSGDDLLVGQSGGTYIFNAGAGADVLTGANGDDQLEGGDGGDELNGGAGNDYASYAHASAGVSIDFSNLGASTGHAAGDTFTSIEGLIGSNFDDVLSWDDNANTLAGGSGNDTLFGNGGSDRLYGDSGNDILIGGAGADQLDGGSGIDAASYANSSVGITLYVGNQAATTGDAVGDTYASIERLIGTAFSDTLSWDDNNNIIEAGAGHDTVFGNGGADELFGEDGNDTLFGGAGADFLSGGAGVDTVAYNRGTVGVEVNLALNYGRVGDAQGDTFSSIEDIVGSNFDDQLTGNAANNFIFGVDGDDRLWGDAGDDILIGGAGADILTGGAGVDATSYHNSSSGVRIVLFQHIGRYGEAEGDQFGSIENIIGSPFQDEIFGDNANNELYGQEDVDVLEGDAGDDYLDGGAGADKIYGQDGNDTLYGGEGQDRLFGGAGADRFFYRDVSESLVGTPDEIVEFTRAHGDKIDLSGIDANTNVGGDQAFSFIGAAAFSSTAGELRYAGNMLEADVNGDGAADFQVQLNVASLQSDDFLL